MNSRVLADGRELSVKLVDKQYFGGRWPSKVKRGE